jgi:hypothetical protein
MARSGGAARFRDGLIAATALVRRSVRLKSLPTNNRGTCGRWAKA